MIIGIFGKCNVGKSSLINILAGQEVAIVSAQPGTTTDPVRKRMEVNGLGACTVIDTAGIDDDGIVGKMRVKKTAEIIKQVDAALLVFTGDGFTAYEDWLAEQFAKYDTPFVIIHNKSDIQKLTPVMQSELKARYKTDVLELTCAEQFKTGQLQNENNPARNLIISVLQGLSTAMEKTILHGLVSPGDHIVLVCPIDSAAPAKRMILPQVMAIRDILDHNAVAHVVQPGQLKEAISTLLPDCPPKLVVTDSQAFKEVDAVLKDNRWESIPLTSFSILLARSKGPFEEYINGLNAIASIKDNDTVLMLESCSHTATCEDIGRVKIPRLLQKFTGKRLLFDFVPSLEKLPTDLDGYALAVQCGGCMVTHKQLNNRISEVIEAGVPVTNYGLLLSYLNGIPINSFGVNLDLVESV